VDGRPALLSLGVASDTAGFVVGVDGMGGAPDASAEVAGCMFGVKLELCVLLRDIFSFVLVGVLVGVVDLYVGGNLNFFVGGRLRVEDGGGKGSFLVVAVDRGDNDATGLPVCWGVSKAAELGDGT
jgi:hypothetical protein